MQSILKIINQNRKYSMFSTMELRLIRHSIHKTMEDNQKKLKILDPESDDAIGLSNDLMLYKIIIDKINENQDV